MRKDESKRGKNGGEERLRPAQLQPHHIVIVECALSSSKLGGAECPSSQSSEALARVCAGNCNMVQPTGLGFHLSF